MSKKHKTAEGRNSPEKDVMAATVKAENALKDAVTLADGRQIDIKTGAIKRPEK